MLFSIDLRLSQKKVDAQAVAVGCPSNGHRASSISALPAPAAQTSAGRTACSLLAAGCAAAHPNQSCFPLLSICDSTAPSSPSPGHSSLGPCHHPPTLVRSARCGQRGQQPRVIERWLYMRGWQWGCTTPMDACMQWNAVRSMWSRNDFHRKYTVHGESQLGPRSQQGSASLLRAK